MPGKAEGVIDRINVIIRSLRQFTRRAEPETPPHAIDLAQMFSADWKLLAMRHRPMQATLALPQGTAIAAFCHLHRVLVVAVIRCKRCRRLNCGYTSKFFNFQSCSPGVL